MKNKVLVENNKYSINGKEYDGIELRKILTKNVKFIILNEKLSIKVFENIKRINDNLLDEIIEEEYRSEGSILTHYEHDKRNSKLYLYSISNGEKINEFINGKVEVEILPIQFYIKEIINKKIFMKRNYIVITSVRNIIYKMKIKNTFIHDCEIVNKEVLSKNIFKDIDLKEEIFIDNTLINLFNNTSYSNYKIKSIKLGEKINEKIL